MDSKHCHSSITKHGPSKQSVSHRLKSVMSVSASLRNPQTRQMKDNKPNAANSLSMKNHTWAMRERFSPYCRPDGEQCFCWRPAAWGLLLHCSPTPLPNAKSYNRQLNCEHENTSILSFRLLPTALVWPFSAAIMRGVLPPASTQFTCALWPSRSCRHSTWSVNAAAWRGVLTEKIGNETAVWLVVTWTEHHVFLPHNNIFNS